MDTSSQFKAFTKSCIEGFEKAGICAQGSGVAVVAIKDENVFQFTHGFSDRKKKFPVTTKTKFALASMTKAFTAAAFLKATELGSFRLQDPVNLKRPLLTFKDPNITKNITILDILSHQGGIPAHDNLWMLTSLDSAQLRQKIKYLDPVPDSFQKQFIYNNLLFSTLRDIFQERRNEKLEDFMQHVFFAPLGMNSTQILKLQQDPNLAKPYRGTDELEFKDTDCIAAAGGLSSNLEDMTKWLISLLIKESIFGEKSFLTLLTKQVDVPAPLPLFLYGLEWLCKDCGYGLGWFLGQTEDGRRAAFIPAMIDGYSSAVVVFPELGLGIMVCTNSNVSPVPGLLSQAIYHYLINKPIGATKASSLALPQMDPTLATSLAFENLDGLCGRYECEAYGLIRVIKEKDLFYLHYGPYKWLLYFRSKSEGAFNIVIFATEFPLPVFFGPGQLSIPMSLDPRVPMQIFIKSS